jgi:hypothetical protein
LPVTGEFGNEFMTLGEHAGHRRRVIVARVDRKRAQYLGLPFARIPFLLLADETVEDTDEIVGPIFRRILDAAAKLEGKEIVF